MKVGEILTEEVMVTLDELYNEPRFREMSEEELARFISQNPTKIEDTISAGDYYRLPPVGYKDDDDKARNLIAYFKEHPLKEEPIRLKEGMGVVNATTEQKIAVEKLARECGLTVYDTLDDGWEAFRYRGDIIVSCLGCSVTHPVTFREFCQAILNEPQKPKEETVKLNNRYRAVIWSGGVNLTLNGKIETSFPLSIIDDLVAAKERVTK